jgi:Protein of unknown function (DUF3828)
MRKTMKKLFQIQFCMLLALTLGSTVTFGQTSASPSTVTKSFYTKYLKLRIRGLPDKRQAKKIAPYFSRQINNLIASDLRKQARFIKKHPREKPPWAEGDLFSSLFEGATSYTVGETRTNGSSSEVDVNLVINSETGKSRWTDTAVLTLQDGRWVITNILFKGKWEFKSGSSLLNALK